MLKVSTTHDKCINQKCESMRVQPTPISVPTGPPHKKYAYTVAPFSTPALHTPTFSSDHHYKCPHCFVESQLATKRIRLTNGSKTAFKEIKQLIKHIEDKHEDIYKKMRTDNKNHYICYDPCCDWAFRNISDFIYHIINNHPEMVGIQFRLDMDITGNAIYNSHPWHSGVCIQEIMVKNPNTNIGGMIQEIVVPPKLLILHQTTKEQTT